MRSLYIIVFVLVMCNIAVTGSTSFTTHRQWSGAWMTDTVDTVANGNSVATDTLAKDSLAVDTLAKDSLAVDTLAKDSLAVDTLSKDSLAVDTLAKDSLAVDTLAKDSAVVDSFARFIVPPMKRVYVHFKEKPEPDPDQKKIEGFIALYKKNLANKTLDDLNAAYTPWKGAFDGCNRRTLDMYMDGIAIILYQVRKDTLEHKYDKLTERREQLMELYDLAADNLADLNSQIDRKRTPDTLSVAKLRAAQFNKFVDSWVIDSIFNSNDTLHNKYTTENIKYWKDTVFQKDSVCIERLYPVLKDIVFSSDNNIGNQGYNMYLYFAGFYYATYSRIIRLNKKNKEYVNKYIKPEIDSITSYVEKRYLEYMEAYPSLLAQDNKNRAKYLNNVSKSKGQIVSQMRELDGAFIDGSDFTALEKMFADRIAKEGFTPDIRDAILRQMKGAPESKVYMDALNSLYGEDPIYENALQIAQYAYKSKDYMKAREFYTKLTTEHELEIFEEEEIKYEAFTKIADCYFKEKGGSYKDLKAGEIVTYIGFNLDIINEFPDDFMACFNIAQCFIYNGAIKGNGEIGQYARSYYAYDWITKAQTKFNATKADSKYSPEQLEKIESNIKSLVSTAYSMLPPKTLNFQTGNKYNNTSTAYFKVKGKPFTTTIRFQN